MSARQGPTLLTGHQICIVLVPAAGCTRSPSCFMPFPWLIPPETGWLAWKKALLWGLSPQRGEVGEKLCNALPVLRSRLRMLRTIEFLFVLLFGVFFVRTKTFCMEMPVLADLFQSC